MTTRPAGGAERQRSARAASLRRVRALVRKELRQLLRDPKTKELRLATAASFFSTSANEGSPLAVVANSSCADLKPANRSARSGSVVGIIALFIMVAE